MSTTHDTRKLLELAAKAAGMIVGDDVMQYSWDYDMKTMLRRNCNGTATQWNPLTDDGDALRLAVKVLGWPHGGRAFKDEVCTMVSVGKLPDNPYAATRLAIVRAAAALGETMP